MILNTNGQVIGGESKRLDYGVDSEDGRLIPLKATNQQEAQALQVLVEDLVNAAARDNHTVLGATHVMVRGERVVGYLSLGGQMTVQCWFHSAIKNPRHSKDMIRHAETLMRNSGVKNYVVCCAAESPFTPNMERLGFTKLGATVLWQKSL